MEDNLPKPIWSGSFWLGDLEMKCHVLDNGQHIIEAESMNNFINGLFGDKPPTEAQIIDFAQWQANKKQ